MNPGPTGETHSTLDARPAHGNIARADCHAAVFRLMGVLVNTGYPSSRPGASSSPSGDVPSEVPLPQLGLSNDTRCANSMARERLPVQARNRFLGFHEERKRLLGSGFRPYTALEVDRLHPAFASMTLERIAEEASPRDVPMDRRGGSVGEPGKRRSPFGEELLVVLRQGRSRLRMRRRVPRALCRASPFSFRDR